MRGAILLPIYAAAAVLLAGRASAFGHVGHALTCDIARALLPPNVTEAIERLILPKDFEFSRACTWADDIRGMPGYEHWRDALHYVDTHDSQPEACSFDYGRDCPSHGCIVSAIYNYTDRLARRAELGSAAGEEAFKMLVHFIGDLHQPLHASGRDYGGTRFHARFEGKYTSLHAVWDYQMIEKRIKEDFDYSIPAFRAHLLEKVLPEVRPAPCREHHRAGDADRPAYDVCPEEWAAETNRIDCTGLVWPADRGEDLGGEYYRRGIAAQEKQMVAAGIRMAAALESILDPIPVDPPPNIGKAQRVRVQQ
ncbi:S1/P1 nuclease [Hyaloraphidium curvatum]|nr:S1/P1 nuclease [Hyaloraphidium curvatum]